MKTVSILEAKTHLSRLLQRVAAGEEIIITRRDHPVARLVPMEDRPAFAPGQFAGRIRVSDDFDDPLPAPGSNLTDEPNKQPEGSSMNLNSILIGSEDPQRLADYYTKLFGEPAWNDGGYIGWLIGSGAITVGPHDQVTGKNVHPGRIIWNIESADVRGDFERFKAAGATVIREPYGFGESSDEATIATFADPDDNYFQLMSPMQPAEGG